MQCYGIGVMFPQVPLAPLDRAKESDRSHHTRLVALVFTDLVDSVALRRSLGDHPAASLLQAYRQQTRELLKRIGGGEEIETAGDSFLLLFERPSNAVRFALLVSAAPGGDIALSDERLLSTRAFANKIWNASRLLLSKESSKPREGTGKAETLADRWIVSRLNACVQLVNSAFEDHRYHEAANAVWHFWWDEFCDWYVEFKKFGTDWSCAYQVYECALRLLHPLMPFITEELWHRLGHEGSIALQPYPQVVAEWTDTEAEANMGFLQWEIEDIRRVRANPNQRLIVEYQLEAGQYQLLSAHQSEFAKLANVELKSISLGGRFFRQIHAPVDRARLEKENAEIEKQIANLERQFEDTETLAKKPEKVIASMRQKLAEYKAKLAKNRDALGS